MKLRTPLKAIILLVFIGALVTGAVLLFSGSKLPAAESTEDIKEYLAANGIITAGEPLTKEIYIPEEFGEVYERYNELQKEQGFDLSPYRGRNARQYTFPVASIKGEIAPDTEAHVIVCDGFIIGGDVAEAAINGKMTGIRGK